MSFLKNLFTGKKEKLLMEAKRYVAKIKAEKKIPTVPSKFLLNDGESVFLETTSNYLETRAVRKSSGGFGGIRIAKGITIGRYAGTSESHQEWRVIDSGKLTLTNKRLVFDGSKENKIIPIDKIFSVRTSLNDIQISIENKAKDSAFTVDNSYMWSLALDLLKQVKNPLDLEGVDLDVELK